jgi:EmrB/QacA subfamily drug resistance transporter
VRERMRDPEYVHDRRWYALIVLCLTLAVLGIDNSVLNVALPTLSRPERAGGLGATASQLQWIVDSYILVFAGLLLTAGSLGDRFGRVRFLNVGLLLFGAGSLYACGASSPSGLITGRVVMGLGAACIMPATLSLITNIFTEPRERAKAIGIWAGVASIGVGLGPILGGLLIGHFWWGSVFLVNVPVVIAALVLGWLLLPESFDTSSPRLDPIGSLLSIVGLVALLWAIIEAPSHGWASSEVLASFALAVLALGAFAAWELRCAHPMLDLHFFQNRRFSAASAAITVTSMALYGVVFLFTQYLQLVLGYSAVEAGATGIPLAMLMVVASLLSPKLVHRFGSKHVIAFGMSSGATAFLLMSMLQADTPFWLVILVTLPLGVGMGNVLSPATDSIMGALPKEKAGVGSAMNDATRQVGGALGVAILGSILSSRFASELSQTLRDVLPAEQLAQAKDSMGEALAIAKEAPSGARIVDAAQQSFLSGMQAAMLVGFLMMVLGIIATLRWLPARAAEPELEPARSLLPAGADGQ